MTGLSFGNDRLSRRRFPIAVVVWVVLLAAGALFVWWGFFAPDGAEEPPQATPTPTATPSLVPLFTQPPSGEVSPTVAPGQTAVATIPLEQETFGYGVATDGLLLTEYTMEQVRNLGLGWVKQQVRWSAFSSAPGQMDWSGYDAVVDVANRAGLRVMLSVVDAPEWSYTYRDSNPEASPPDDLALYAEFLGQLVDRYRGRVHAIEVWNEQNLDREWDTAEGVNPARYVEMLRLAYQVIKSRDPNIIVISGALSPVGATATDPNNPARVIYMNDRDYFQRAVANGMLNYCDCIGVHHNGYNIPPDVHWNDAYQDATAVFRGFWDTPDISWSFISTLEWYNQAAGGTRPLCVTEFGWASSEGFGGYPPGLEFAQDNTLQEQADYDVQAFQLMRQWGFVRLAFLWNLDYATKGPRLATDPNAPYSITDMYGGPRPAFWAIMQMEKP